MLIIEVKDGKIEGALKTLKAKVRNTKQNEQLKNRKEYTKKSVSKRQQKISAIYKQSKRVDD